MHAMMYGLQTAVEPSILAITPPKIQTMLQVTFGDLLGMNNFLFNFFLNVVKTIKRKSLIRLGMKLVIMIIRL